MPPGALQSVEVCAAAHVENETWGSLLNTCASAGSLGANVWPGAVAKIYAHTATVYTYTLLFVQGQLTDFNTFGSLTNAHYTKSALTDIELGILQDTGWCAALLVARMQIYNISHFQK